MPVQDEPPVEALLLVPFPAGDSFGKVAPGRRNPDSSGLPGSGSSIKVATAHH